MPDTTSQYRQIRLSVFPSPDGQTCRWSMVALAVRRGVPHGTILADGSMLTPYGCDTELALWETILTLAQRETSGPA